MSLISKFKSQNEEQALQTFKAKDPSIRAYSDRISYLRNDVPLYKPTNDQKSHVRLIPMPDGSGYFSYPVLIHFGLGAEGNSVCCPVMKKEKCPLCVHSKQLYSEGAKEQAKQFRAATYNLCWIIDRADQTKGPQMWPIANATITTIRNLMTNPRTGAIQSLCDIYRGFDLFFVKRKDSATAMFFTINDLMRDTDPTPLSIAVDDASFAKDKQLQEWLQFVDDHQVNDIVNYIPQEQMETLAFGPPITSDDETPADEETTVTETNVAESESTTDEPEVAEESAEENAEEPQAEPEPEPVKAAAPSKPVAKPPVAAKQTAAVGKPATGTVPATGTSPSMLDIKARLAKYSKPES